MTESTVQLPRGRIALRQAGDVDAFPCVLLHGIPASSALWPPACESLARRFRCVAPDLMGLGRSVPDPQRTGASVPDQARMVTELLDALDIERAHVVGHDFGGAVAQYLAVHHPARVERLVLADSVAYDNWPVPGIRRLRAAASNPLVGRLVLGAGLLHFRKALEVALASLAGRPVVAREEAFIRDCLAPFRGDRAALERCLWFLRALDSCHTRQLAARLPALRLPVMVLWGAEDRFLSPAWGERLHRDIPGSLLETVPGAPHFWPFLEPEAFAARVGGFLGGRQGQGRVPPILAGEQRS